MPWNIIMGPVLFCLIWGIKSGLKVKADKPFTIDRRTSLYE